MRSDHEKRWILETCHSGIEGTYTYKLYNFSVSMDWAVGCHLGRDKTFEKVSSRFYWRNNSKSGMNIKKTQVRDKCYYDKNTNDLIIFVCHILENTLLDR